MSTLDVRPYAALTNDELATLSRTIARCSDDLARQQASVQTELELRMQTNRDDFTHFPPGIIGASEPPTNHPAGKAPFSRRYPTGESYVRASRKYAIKWLTILVASVIAFVGAVYLLVKLV